MILLSIGGLLFAPSAAAQSSADSSALRQVALDYIEGWYTADAERMERALHPALRKRMVYTHPKTGADSLDRQTARTLIQDTDRSTPTPKSQRRAEVTILDVYKDIATVRVDAQRFVDHLQVAKWRGDWKIVNVLWELRQQPTAAKR
jgi:hypothetical protein